MVAQTNQTDLPATVTTPEHVEALLETVRYGDMEDVTSLADAAVPLDSKDEFGRTALHMAAANGHNEIVSYLLNKGAVTDINAINTEKNTPLHWACLNGHVQVVKILILAGADANMLNSHERTPVDEAVSRGKMDVIDAINESAAQLELTCVDISE